MRMRTHITRSISLAVGILLAQPYAVSASTEVAAQLSTGVWRSIVIGGTNVHDYPLTAIGRERFENYSLERDGALTCDPPGMPRGFYHLSPMTLSFDGDTTTIRYETMDVVRTVHMDGDPLPDGALHTPNGHSIGRWEGEALIVETTHLEAGETSRDGVPKSAHMTLRESIGVEDRDDGPHMIVIMTITDPENFAEPFTSVNDFVLEPDWELLTFDCKPTVY